jgi:hypothetical protein
MRLERFDEVGRKLLRTNLICGPAKFAFTKVSDGGEVNRLEIGCGDYRACLTLKEMRNLMAFCEKMISHYELSS